MDVVLGYFTIVALIVPRTVFRVSRPRHVGSDGVHAARRGAGAMAGDAA